MSDSINIKKGEFAALVQKLGNCGVAVIRDNQPFKAPVAKIVLCGNRKHETVRTVRGPGVYRAGKPIELREQNFKKRIDFELAKFQRWLKECKGVSHGTGR